MAGVMSPKSAKYSTYFAGLSFVYFVEMLIIVLLLFGGPGDDCGPVCPISWVATRKSFYKQTLTAKFNNVSKKVTRAEVLSAYGSTAPGRIFRYDLYACAEASPLKNWVGEDEIEKTQRADFPAGPSGRLKTPYSTNPAEEGGVDFDVMASWGSSQKLPRQIIQDSIYELLDGGAVDNEPPYEDQDPNLPGVQPLFPLWGGMSKAEFDDIQKGYIEAKGKPKFWCIMCIASNDTQLYEPCEGGTGQCKDEVMPGMKKSDFPVETSLTQRGNLGLLWLLLFVCFVLQLVGCLLSMLAMQYFTGFKIQDFTKISCKGKCLGAIVRFFPKLNRMANLGAGVLSIMNFYLLQVMKVCEDAQNANTSLFNYGRIAGEGIFLIVVMWILLCVVGTVHRRKYHLETAFVDPALADKAGGLKLLELDPVGMAKRVKMIAENEYVLSGP